MTVHMLNIARLPILNRLWAKETRRPLNLLAPDVVMEAHFHVLQDGTSKLYVSKLPPDMKPEELVYIVTTLLDQVVAFGAQHGVQVQVKAEGKP